MITGQGTLSLRKKDLENQKVPAIGFQKLYFAHKATAGASSINLLSLSTPSEMSVLGFQQPTTTQLQGAQLLFYKNNLRLESSLRGLLIQGLSYVVSSSTQILLVGFTAAEGEIFTGTIDYSAQTGIKVVDATAQPATGTIAAGQTDFNIGQSFQTNKYSTAQVGACLVYVDGVLQFRNTGNSSVVKDGNYFELDNGSGSFSVIRMNTTDTNIRNVVVVPNGLLSERPDGSMMAVIEAVQGQINNMATYVADATGQTTTTVLGAAPSNVDLKSFGDKVSGLAATTNHMPALFTFNSWNPSDVAGANTNANSLGTSAGDQNVSFSALSGGLVTITFNTPGVYEINIPVQHISAANASLVQLTLTYGGTASIFNIGTWQSRVIVSGGSNNPMVSSADFFIVSATAGQTLTVRGQFLVVGSGTTANHTAIARGFIRRIRQ